MITKDNIKCFIPDRFSDDGENRFFSNRLEAIYVYPDKVKYWEDWRATNVYEEISLPILDFENFEKLVSQHSGQWEK